MQPATPPRSRTAIVVLVLTTLLQVVPTQAQSLLEVLLSPFLNLAASSTCSTIQDIFFNSSEAAIECECDASFTLIDGIEVGVLCGNANEICLLQNSFCGTSTFSVDYGIRTGLGSGEACLKFDTLIPGLPPALVNLINIPELCIKGTADRGLRFGECSVTIGDTECQECTVCSSGLDVTFDCSNANLNPIGSGVLKIPGPKVTQCLGIGLVPGLGARESSVRAFGTPGTN
jgi:hypothetical protein